MNQRDTADDSPATPPPRIDSRAAFTAALRWGFAEAIRRDARRIVCIDPTFAHWPFGAADLLDELTAWLKRPQRQLVLVAVQYDEVARAFPRFVAWRRLWAHAVPAYAVPEDSAADVPTWLLDDGPVLVRLHDAVHWRGRAEYDARAARPFREEIDALLQRSEPSFAPTQLGL